jgi:pyruvate kinase|tara:strand:- start:305 stop:1297 length:993 start_codon:yes stop_codon:yes gene_type:complete
MSQKKIKIICTLGPRSLNKEFLKFAKNKISLLRLNMSHLSLEDLKKSIKFIKKYTKIPICIDTEGAQIRTKVKKERFLKLGQKIKIVNTKNNLNLYPETTYKQIKINDILNVGFNNLKLKVLEKKNHILCKVLSSGKLENNKGVHLENRKIKLNFLTKKDFNAIKMGKRFKIKNYALSFTNSVEDINKFSNLLKNTNKIFKIETLSAVKNFKKIIKKGNYFLIDRGDLSKDVKIENIPIIQRNLFNIKKNLNNKRIFVATNLLESMLENNFPTRGEANDIFNSLEMGADGLVLAAETAIGKHPQSSVKFLQRMIKTFKKSKHKYKSIKYF